MNTTLPRTSGLAALQPTHEPLFPIDVEPIGPSNIVRIDQPEHLPILASLSNTWLITAAQKGINESLALHFIATTESGERILICQDLLNGTWYRHSETTSNRIMAQSTC